MAALFFAFLGGQVANGESFSLPVKTLSGLEMLWPEGMEGSRKPYLLVKLEEESFARALPMQVDTTLLKKGSTSNASSLVIQIRDNRWHQALFLPDFSSLPTGATVEWAEFHFYASWAERNAPGSIKCYRMLKEWSADATWVEDGMEPSTSWNGLRRGTDYDAEAFAELSFANFSGGSKAITGFSELVSNWEDASASNFGFVVQLGGAVMQVNIASTENAHVEPVDDSQIRSESGLAQFQVEIDLRKLRRLVISPADLLGAELAFHYETGVVSDSANAEVGDFGDIAAISSNGELRLKNLAEILVPYLSSKEESVVFGISVPIAASARLASSNSSDALLRPTLELTLPDYAHHDFFENRVVPTTGVYTTVKNGHFYYGDERLRLWGTLGRGDIGRVKRMGYNGWRLWPTGAGAYDQSSVATGDFPVSAAGDGSDLDYLDRTIADCREHGVFVMATQLMGMMPSSLLAQNGSFISGGEDWEEWKEAVQFLHDASLEAYAPQHAGFLAFVDDRLFAARLKHVENILQRRNPYTGRRYGEEETIAIWELNNELGFVKAMLDGQFREWPDYFKHKLATHWNDWLRARYGGTTELAQAWGVLGSGEVLGSVELTPVVSNRNEYPWARGSDVVRFFIELADTHYQTIRSHARAQAPDGVGVAVAPFSFDTQYRPNLPWLYSQSRSDVANFGMYFWNLDSTLGQPPSAYVMDSSTVLGKPTVIYETNRSRPSAYRAEYPYQLAALASWQDWDAVFFHYWGVGENETDESFLLAKMKNTNIYHYWDAVHHDVDPVMTSAIATAGRMFLNFAIKPAENPVIYTFGREAIFSFDYINGKGVGTTTYQQGTRFSFEPEANGALTQSAHDSPQPTGAVSSGQQILWDWPNRRLMIDTPFAKAFVGPPAAGGWSSGDGFILKSSVDWLAFGLVSKNGSLLNEVDEYFVSAVGDAVNAGFAMNPTNASNPVDQAKEITHYGRSPVLVAPITFELSFPTRETFESTSYDFALRALASSRADTQRLEVLLEGDSQDATDPASVALPTHSDLATWLYVVDYATRLPGFRVARDQLGYLQTSVSVGGTMAFRAWMAEFGIDPAVRDPYEDYDTDGLDNISEYIYGLDPTRYSTPTSRQDIIELDQSRLTVRFSDTAPETSHFNEHWEVSGTDFIWEKSIPISDITAPSSEEATTVRMLEFERPSEIFYIRRVLSF